MKINGEVFEQGLNAHSRSEFIFPLAGKWKTFTATIGLREGALDQGSAVFTILDDSRELFRSKILRPGEKETGRVESPNVQTLTLRAEAGEGHSHDSWAIWADPVVEK